MNILNIEHVSKIFGDKKIFDDVSYGVQEGDKIGIVGLNGTGKTTMLNIIAGVEEVDEGQIIMQNGIRLAYLSQNPCFLEHATVLSYALDGIDETDWTAQSEVKSALNQLGITNHEQRVSELSGGQKKKVALAKVLTGSFDILLLDEPTNHLDSGMLVWLEDYLKSYKGVVIMVTHDRYFLDKVTNFTCELENGHLTEYNGNYSYYREKKLEMQKELESTQEISNKKATTENKTTPKTKQEKAKPKNAHVASAMSSEKLTMMIQRCEATIAMFEAELKGLEYQMNDPALQADPNKSHEIATAYAQKEQELEEKYIEWDKLTEELANKA